MSKHVNVGLPPEIRRRTVPAVLLKIDTSALVELHTFQFQQASLRAEALRML
jgi:hypothetical protein